ncbi:hypothetical protein AG1IA_02998 [Rhizoctonia solani AG-1 IA]|uniref:Uncharacterized protein n=1 Tax=Thanatephorus cucumeris (strain AG1-IA) TaxID=983506 RepID=L8WY21_THACA|nr:hypothetical protein AG1IA_02998 [Rhizoctonia solani AG-1 IA]
MFVWSERSYVCSLDLLGTSREREKVYHDGSRKEKRQLNECSKSARISPDDGPVEQM